MFSKKSSHFSLIIPMLPGCLLLLCVVISTSHAQITLDGSLGPGGPLTGPDYIIGADLGETHGSNLFHSFGEFNVNTGESATFTGPNSIENVIGRVTGGNVSLIDGLIRCAILDADLFLVNPSGIMFGLNATLDLDGSFHVSTADYLRLGDGGSVFYTDPSQSSGLTVAPPEAFGFLGADPAKIIIEGSKLEVPKGETLSVVCGDMEITGGTINAPSGRINIASVASQGEVIPNMPDQAPDLTVDTFEVLGDIDISQEGALYSTGDIFIRGGSLSLDQSGIYSLSFGTEDAGDIDICLTEDFSLTGASGYTAIHCASYLYGEAGDILLDVGRLTIADGAQILSHAMDDCTGQGGNIRVKAAESVSISGDSNNIMQTYISSSTYGNADAGTVSISTPTLIIEDNSGILSGANRGIDWMGNQVVGGRAGEISLDVGSLTITSASIGCQSATPYDAGNISVTATESVSISDGSIATTTWDAGDGGTISITTPLLTMDCAVLDARAEHSYALGDAGEILLAVGSLALIDGSQIQTSTEGVGRGGDVTITATDSISISGSNIEGYDSGIISSTWGSGNGGKISISAPSLTIVEGALSAQSILDGDSGGILVQVGNLALSSGGQISTASFGSGHGGDITVTATDSILISGRHINRGFSSNISSFAFSEASGRGGNIALQAREIQLFDGALISAKSFGTGLAGDIFIDSGYKFISRNSFINTEALETDGGNIDLRAQYMVHLIDSEFTASVGGGPETTGGNITIDPEYVILQESDIIANAYEGTGGNILISAGTFLADPYSVVSASSDLGIDGTVDVQAPITNVSGFIAPLKKSLLSPEKFLRDPCEAAIRGGEYSSFFVRGRDGLPIQPDGVLPSPLFSE